ncbi:FAD-linked oxidase C-terminal domain-containing protein [Conexibacter sp. JD483]|uniref:FAD-binding oxidoreductase n=1 Tax=unclassified Conexibacter TaxID=2627773 RepID=UPI0027175964|nr:MULTISPECIES: FAD-linked oxidase C-terminal domain-containing protein [unclassified Conexibacter]MDO8185061.1 FAD-linked oxidase C-terminal domain-containing protein [Conexibacter sp. CPCC 205706]MDO8196771.1 FAD-linked oxidase C-terminal domain-containing protein [Conexibacter sp. CPCC 205762]MDR9368019.1 FAD-linked oxidase C-terminal domain-containing protein [Conexibacter sp. JD483]
MTTTAALLDDLAAAAAGDLVTDPEVLASYERDQAAPALVPAGRPAAVIRPRTTQEVQQAVKAAARHKVPVVPRGAGSGLSGGANAIDGCLVVSLERMTDIAEIDGPSMLATVQPGLVNAQLREAAGREGLFYAPDPASWEFSTIGGNIATNAGGLCCVKYGVTRDALLGLEVVTADGRAVRIGRRARKGVAGYDLASLFCGSEGTLGIVTEATMRLIPPPRSSATLAASFPSLGSAGHAIAKIVRNSTPSVLELMDRTTIQAVERMAPQGLDEEVAVLVFARSDLGGAAALREVDQLAKWCEEAGATLAVTTDEEAEGRMLMAARRLAYSALEHQGATLLDDVGVPLGQIPALLDGIEAVAERHGVLIGTFGHAGDGNMHPTIVFDQHDPEAVARANAAFAELVRLALGLGGTVSGEHGVGLLKRDFLPLELGEAHSLNHAIKHALDPHGLFNPGKAI